MRPRHRIEADKDVRHSGVITSGHAPLAPSHWASEVNKNAPGLHFYVGKSGLDCDLAVKVAATESTRPDDRLAHP